MYLLSDRSFQEMKDELLRRAMDSMAQKNYASVALKSETSSKSPVPVAEEQFSEIARETLKVLRGEWSGGPSYNNLYPIHASATLRRDVAQAMAHRWTQDGHSSGAFDEIALELFQHYFDRFEDSGFSMFTGVNSSNETFFGFEDLRSRYLDSFLEKNYNRSLSVQFNLYSGKSSVKLELGIGVTGNAVWDLRGTSQLKKSHRKLRDDLQAVVRDFHSRLGWMAEYISSGSKPGIEEPQLSMVQEVLQYYYHEGTVDLEPLEPGIRFEDEPLVLEEKARGFIGRCEHCDQIVALELFKHIGPSWEDPDWTNDLALYRNRYAEENLHKNVFEPIHWACAGNSYLSSRTGQLMPINS